MYNFTFTIEVVAEEREHPIKTYHGIVAAQSYSNAVEKITNFFDDDKIVEIKSIIALDDWPIILTEEIVKDILDDKYFKD